MRRPATGRLNPIVIVVLPVIIRIRDRRQAAGRVGCRRRRNHDHILSWPQIREQILPVRTGCLRSNRIAIHISHRIAAGILQIDLDPLNAGFIVSVTSDVVLSVSIILPVIIQIMPNQIPDVDRRVEAEINCQIAVPIVRIRSGRRLLLRSQCNDRAGGRAADSGLTAVIIIILSIISHIRHVAAGRIAGRRRQNRDRVRAGGEIIEQIFSAAGGRCRKRHRIARAVRAGQRHGYAIKSAFAEQRFIDAIVIGVMPDEIANADRLV